MDEERRQKKHKKMILCVPILVVCAIIDREVRRRHTSVHRSLRLESENVRSELLTYLFSDIGYCRSITRMSPRALLDLCKILIEEGGLRPSVRATPEEQVVKSLYLLGHNVTNRELCVFFRRSGETISRHFHNVLNAIIELEDRLLKQSDGSLVPSEIFGDTRFYPYFKDCIGAIDGTHIRVKVSNVEAPRYRGRKDYPTQNVLASCTFDLKLSYVLTGWEGTASDSRIIKNALTRNNCLKIPEGKYYLVDAGFMLRSGLITPYRGVRYHLKEYSGNLPRNARELFNHRHSSLRNTIERVFGVLKKRFPIIASGTEPNYRIKTQNKIILSCCILHNYLVKSDPDEELLAEVDQEIEKRNIEEVQVAPTDDHEDVCKGETIRDSIAYQMWADYSL